MASIWITGAAGFLGSHLVEHYLNEGFHVVGIDNFSSGSFSNVEEMKKHTAGIHNYFFIEEDVTRPWLWEIKIPKEFKKDILFLFHFASPASPIIYERLALETMWVNSIGLQNAISFAVEYGAKVIFSSTSEIYGDPSVNPQPESYWGNVNTQGPRSCYDEGKRFGEALIFTHNLKHKTKHGLVRIFNTYGPRMNPNDGRVVINFLTQAIQGKTLTLYGSGMQTRSFCYYQDLIDGITSYAAKDLIEAINLGNEEEFTIKELAQLIQELFPEKKIELEYRPLPQDDPKQRRPNLSKAKIHLPHWKAKTSLKEGLQKTLAWLILQI